MVYGVWRGDDGGGVDGFIDSGGSGGCNREQKLLKMSVLWVAV